MIGDLTTFGLEDVVFALFVSLVIIMLLESKYTIPLIGVVNRWVRWIFFSLGIGVLFADQHWTNRPVWAVVTVTFLGWFIVVTVYYWLYARAVSFSQTPLLPKYRSAERDEWPVDTRLIALKSWLRSEGYKQISFLRAELGEDVFIRNAVYENEAKTQRIQVVFLPINTPSFHPFFIISSIAEDGRRLITNNILMPFGGTYPENWNVVRKPLINSLPRLLKTHKSVISKLDLELAVFEENALDDINDQQILLEKKNIQSGFILPREYHEEFGILSLDARYKLWKEIWLISYLGFAADHRIETSKTSA